jgi:DNA polymerase-1
MVVSLKDTLLQVCFDNKQCYQLEFSHCLSIFSTPALKIIGYDLKPLLKQLLAHNIDCQVEFIDLKLAAYVINSTDELNVNALMKKYLNVSVQEDNIVALLFLSLYAEFLNIFAHNTDIRGVFYNIETPVMHVLALMEHYGVYIDVNVLHQQSTEITTTLHNLEQEIFAIAEQSFNLSSPKQLQEIMFEKLKLPIIKKTPKGQPSTDESVLQELAREFVLPKLLLSYRSLFKLKSTYTDRLPQDVNPQTKRIHTTYQQTVTSTGRLSSIEPNLQNIPVKTAEGRKIRQAFVAPKGKIIIAADYSQIELRILAHLSCDPMLLQTFAQGLDVHTATASEVFEVNINEVTGEQRRRAKTINFGLIYGMGATGLSKQLDIDKKQAQAYIDAYFAKFSAVKEFLEKTKTYASKNGFVHTMFGRRLYLPDINSNNALLKNAAERAAINAPMQGAQADIIKMAMIKLNTWQKTTNDVTMIMQIHDELIFETTELNLEHKIKTIGELMQNAASLQVPLLVDIGMGANWDSAKA